MRAGSTTGLPRSTHTPEVDVSKLATRRFTFAVHRYDEFATGTGEPDRRGTPGC
jgi:hypothetical protein